MSLDEFIEFEKKRLEAFKIYWEENHSLTPEMFPMSMDDDNDGVWFEMFDEFEMKSDF